MSRWRHKCPSCKRVIHWERIYCQLCIKADPKRARFRMDRLSSYRKGARNGVLPTVQQTREHLFALIKAYALCVECGHTVKLNDVKHKCYFLTDAAVKTMTLIRCRVCKYKKAKHVFPTFKRRGRLLRARVCSDCLHNSQVIPIHKYERRVHAGDMSILNA